jgi:hypothetical protein
VPASPIPLSPGDPGYSIFQMQKLNDWVTNPNVTVKFGEVEIGKAGSLTPTATGKALAVAAGRG